jgi:CO dehydrogenase/acetyl-CoA synthase gamma subunit (corrinoid Fe-S protein)
MVNGAAVSVVFCQFDDARRYELGVEAICRLATDVVAVRLNGRNAEAAADSVDRYRGIVYAVSTRSLPAARAAVTQDMLVWMCLARAANWMKNLVHLHSRERWEELRETIVAWQDAWGNDARAKYAQARFTTLTGIVRGATEEQGAYMRAALVKALSDVQA